MQASYWSMGVRILKGIGITVGVLVLALLAFIVVYLIGYGLYAVFSQSGMQTSTARGVGVGITVLAALLLLAIYFLSRRGWRLQEPRAGRNSRGKRAA